MQTYSQWEFSMSEELLVECEAQSRRSSIPIPGCIMLNVADRAFESGAADPDDYMTAQDNLMQLSELIMVAELNKDERRILAHILRQLADYASNQKVLIRPFDSWSIEDEEAEADEGLPEPQAPAARRTQRPLPQLAKTLERNHQETP